MSGLSGHPSDGHVFSRMLNRRQVIRAGGALGVGALLAACSGTQGSAANGPTTPSGPGSSPAASDPSAAASSGSSAARSAPSSIAPGSVDRLDETTTATLTSLFDKVFASTGVAGMAAGVWIGKDSWSRSAGYADLASQAEFRPADHVRIASITKSYAATATLRLVDQGALAITDTLESFVPGVANGAQITLKDLLGMTSGIYDFTSDAAFLSAFDADPTMAWSDAQTLEIIARHDPLFAPGAEL